MSGSIAAHQTELSRDAVRGVIRWDSFSPFGMGERGEHCGASRLTDYMIEALGLKIKYMGLSCGRIDCPDCYSTALRKDVFNAAVLIEAYARVTGQRPATVITSVRPGDTVGWTHEDYQRRLNQRGYRELRKMGAVGGWMATHPYRLSEDAKRGLRALGYRDGMTRRKGFWDGVRHDVLGLGDWRAYVVSGFHRHGMVFPSFLREHEDSDFFVAKGRVLGTVRDVIAYMRYVLSHAGKEPGTRDKVSGMWGIFSGRTPWRPEDHMTADELNALRSEIAELLGMRWEDGELITHPKDEDEQPWEPVRTLASRINNEDVREHLSADELEFARELVMRLGGTVPLGKIPTGREALLLESDVEPLRPASVRVVRVTRTADESVEDQDEDRVNCEDESRG